MKRKHKRKLERSLRDRREVRVFRNLVDADPIWGYVLGLSPELVLVYLVTDFHLEGCRVYRTRDIRKVNSGKFEAALDRIMEAEGLIDGIGISEVPPLHDMAALLSDLCERRAPAIIRCERPKGKSRRESKWQLGYVTRVGKKRCRVAAWTPFVGWHDEPESFPIRQVTCVQIESAYVDRWLRHADPCPSL